MIDRESSIPKASPKYLYGLSKQYKYDNDLLIFIEDERLSNLYLLILQKLLPNIKLNRVFPLYGKKQILEYAQKHSDSTEQVFIADKDFDDIFADQEQIRNLFYLDRYSIENYFLEQDAVVEFILSEKTTLERGNITDTLDYNSALDDIMTACTKVVLRHLVVLTENLGIKCIDRSIDSFVEVETDRIQIRRIVLEYYEDEIEEVLKQKDGRLSLNGRLRNVDKYGVFKNQQDMKANIPGKYLIHVLIKYISKNFDIRGITQDSYMYRVAKESEFISLRFLQERIEGLIDKSN